MPTLPTAPTTLPNPPDPANRATFNALAYPWSAALPTFGAQLTALGTNGYNNAVEAAASAIAAAAQTAASTAQAAAAQASATAAAASANTAAISTAPAWVSGTTYAAGAIVCSTINLFIYRRKTAGTGTIDPSLDSTNWASAVYLPPPVPLGGAIWINSQRANPGNTYVQEGYTYLRTGVLALKSSFPSYPSTYALTTPAGYTSISSSTTATALGQKSLSVGGGVAVVTRTSGSISYSADGLAWTLVSGLSCWDGLTYGAGLHVLYGANNGSLSNVLTSQTGVTWTSRAMPSSQPWLASDYANSKFLAVSATASSTVTAVSADGMTWAAGGATPAHTGQWRVPARVGSAWVLTESGGSGAVAYSTDDGATWAAGTGGTAIASASYGNTSAIAILAQGASTAYRYTLDGMTWANGTFPVAAAGAGWKILPSFGGTLFAMNDSGSGGIIYYSANGTTWTSIGFSVWNLYKIGATYYATVSVTSVRTSTDLIAWSANKDAIGAPYPQMNERAAYETFNGHSLAVASGGSKALFINDNIEYTGEATAVTNGIFVAYVRAS